MCQLLGFSPGSLRPLSHGQWMNPANRRVSGTGLPFQSRRSYGLFTDTIPAKGLLGSLFLARRQNVMPPGIFGVGIFGKSFGGEYISMFRLNFGLLSMGASYYTIKQNR